MLKSGQPFTAPHFPTPSVVGLKTAPAGPVVRDPIPLGSSKGMEGASEGGVNISNVMQMRVCLLQTVKMLLHQRKLVLVKVGNGAGGVHCSSSGHCVTGLWVWKYMMQSSHPIIRLVV